MQKSPLILGIVVALLIGAALGYAGASYQYSTVLDKARSAFPTPPTMSVISGTITEIDDNVVTIRTFSTANPLETLPEVRKVTVTGDTQIVKNEPKDPRVVQQEMDAYQKAMQISAPASGTSTVSATNLPTPPTPMEETVLSLADLKVGDMVMVDAGEDVKTSTSFDAVKISVTGTSPVVAPPMGAPAGADGAPTAAAQNPSPAPIVPPPPATR